MEQANQEKLLIEKEIENLNKELSPHQLAFKANEKKLAKYQPKQTPKLSLIKTKKTEKEQIDRINGLIEAQKNVLQPIKDRIQGLEQQINALNA